VDLGTGVFLGLTVVALVWLYVATRDRWKWRRVIGWSLGLALLPVVGFAGWLGYQTYIDAKPRRETSMWDLSPGMAASDVIFRKGEPSEKAESTWYYKGSDYEPTHVVSFADDRVKWIVALSPTDLGSLPTVQGISSYSSLEDIEKRFGKAESISVSADHTRRVLTYSSFGLVFWMKKNRVQALGVIDPEAPPVRLSEEASHTVNPPK